MPVQSPLSQYHHPERVRLSLAFTETREADKPLLFTVFLSLPESSVTHLGDSAVCPISTNERTHTHYCLFTAVLCSIQKAVRHDQ